jgi:hypothetical protein
MMREMSVPSFASLWAIRKSRFFLNFKPTRVRNKNDLRIFVTALMIHVCPANERGFFNNPL